MQQVVKGMVFAVLALLPLAAQAQTSPVVLVYDHASVNRDMELRVSLRPGDRFQVEVLHTCPSFFDYSVNRITKVATPRMGVGPDTRLELEPMTLDPVVHEAQYAAYEVEISKSTGGTPCVKPLNEVTLRVVVETLDWRFVQSAALAMTWGKQPRYFAQAQAVGEGEAAQFKVVRDQGEEDPGRFEIATLTHIFPPGRQFGVAVGFGAEQNQLQYYLGGSFDPTRGSHLFNISAGFVWASMARLPDGIRENDIISDAAKLNNLPTKRRVRLFFAVTASFFQSGQGKATAPAK